MSKPTVDEILKTVLELLQENLHIPDPKADDTAELLGLDSLDGVELILGLEERLNVAADTLDIEGEPTWTLRQWVEEIWKHLDDPGRN